MPDFKAFENDDFTLTAKLKAGYLWAGFNGTELTEIPDQFQPAEVFNDSYHNSLAYFMAMMVTEAPQLMGKKIIGVPRALASQQPSDNSKNAVHIAYNALFDLAKDEEYCKAVQYHERDDTDDFPTGESLMGFMRIYQNRHPESGFIRTAINLFKAARSSTPIKYTKQFVDVTQRVMRELNIELEHTKFIFPAQRWTTFVNAHALLQWARDFGHWENDSKRANALIDTLEHLYGEGACE